MDKIINDQLGRELKISTYPTRIVSLVPSQTELLFELGLDAQVVGITKFCIHPEEWFNSKTKIGGTKNFDINKIRELQPDLIIANKEENDKDLLEALMKDYPVWVSDVTNLESAIDMIAKISTITGKISEGNLLITKIKDSFSRLKATTNKVNKTVVYYIWQKPWLSVGRDTFIYDMLLQNGLQPITKDLLRYPEIAIENLNPETNYIFLSTEPYPFNEKHRNEISQLYPKSEVILVDGEYFSWYGSRLKDAPDYFKKLNLQP